MQVHANEGGVTQTRGGVYWLILPAGCNYFVFKSSKISSASLFCFPKDKMKYPLHKFSVDDAY